MAGEKKKSGISFTILSTKKSILMQEKYVKQNSLKSISYLLCYTIICQQEVADFCISFCECEKIQRSLMLTISLF